MEMPDAHLINSHAKAATKPEELSPARSLSSTSSQSPSSSPKPPPHRRFLSLDSLEATSNKILTHIRSSSRSSSPHPGVSSPTPNNQQEHSAPPSTTVFPTALQSDLSSSPPVSPTSLSQSYSPSGGMSPNTYHHAQRPSIGQSRTSDASTSSMDSSARTRSNSYKRYSGTVNHYGRHSNDWLFGGFSVRDTVRDGIEKLRGGSDRDS